MSSPRDSNFSTDCIEANSATLADVVAKIAELYLDNISWRASYFAVQILHQMQRDAA
jgi:hypothetical protein